MAGKILPLNAVDQTCVDSEIVGKRNDYGAQNTANCVDNAFPYLTCIAGLAIVIVAICCKQHFGLNLAKSIDDTVDSEIR